MTHTIKRKRPLDPWYGHVAPYTGCRPGNGCGGAPPGRTTKAHTSRVERRRAKTEVRKQMEAEK